MKFHRKLVCSCALLLSLGSVGCSGDDEEKAPEEAVAAEGETNGTEPAAPEDDTEVDVEAAPQSPIPAEPAPAQATAAEPTLPRQVESIAGFNPGNHLFVHVTILRIRSTPEKNGKTVGSLPYGTKVQVLETKGRWIKIGENEWVGITGLTTQYQYSNKQH